MSLLEDLPFSLKLVTNVIFSIYYHPLTQLQVTKINGGKSQTEIKVTDRNTNLTEVLIYD